MNVYSLTISIVMSLALAGAPQAQTISGDDTAAVLKIAQGYGEAALAVRDDGAPQITGQIDGITYQVYFLNCAGQSGCQDLNFYLGFLDVSPDLDTINDWNTNRRFSRAYLDPDQDASVEMDVDLAGGVTVQFLDAQFYIWRQVITQFATHIGYR